MRTLIRLLLILAVSAVAQTAAAQTRITCESQRNLPQYCPADTRGGVRLAKQKSDLPCREGITWGYDYRGVWVDRGCRAEFEIGRGGGQGGGSQTITCESRDNRRQQCRVNTSGGVRLTRQISDAPCRERETWGYDANGIWVNRGCRAEFQVGRAGSGGPGGGWGGNRTETITCASERNQPGFCPANTRGGVRLTRQLSNAPCRESDTWGYDRRGIWVDRGCRAEFEVRGALGSDRPEIITCSSEDRRRQVCPADTRGGVRLVRQISDADCREGSSWGYDTRGIWVDRGCRAEFEIRSGGWGWEPRPGGGGSTQTITCESRNNRRQVCAVEIRGTVRLTKQLSDRACRERETWGYDNRGIWVDRGCRAEFEISGRDRGGRDRGRGFERLEAHLQACEDEVLSRVQGSRRGDVDLEDATQGGVGTYLVEWRTDSGATGFCRVNRNNKVVQFKRD